VTRVGADVPIPLNVRVIAAANRSLGDLVEEGKFRSGLYYRLNFLTNSSAFCSPAATTAEIAMQRSAKVVRLPQ
jgi:sigma54-dependent transcription regulator